MYFDVDIDVLSYYAPVSVVPRWIVNRVDIV